MFARIHSALSLATPSSGSSVVLYALSTSGGTGLPGGQYAPVVVVASRTRPSISAGDTPASAIARRNAMRLMAPDGGFRPAVPTTRGRGVADPDGGHLAAVFP